jgi:hypothetical protein
MQHVQGLEAETSPEIFVGDGSKLSGIFCEGIRKSMSYVR